MVAHRTGGKLLWADDKRASPNIFSLMPGCNREHPNEKPLGLVDHFLTLHSLPDQIVLDPFMGGGTTGVSAVNLGRRFIGVEIDSKHFDTACRRIDEAVSQPRMFISAKPVPVQEVLL